MEHRQPDPGPVRRVPPAARAPGGHPHQPLAGPSADPRVGVGRGGEQRAEVRATFSAAAAAARSDVVAAALAAHDPDRPLRPPPGLAAARARAGGIVVTDGPWVLTWDGGRGYTLETLTDDGQALSVLDEVPYAVDDPGRGLMLPLG